jgi:hypothetical protein
MDPIEALRAIRVFIDVASESDDIFFIHKQLREMRGVVDNTLPSVKRPYPPLKLVDE